MPFVTVFALATTVLFDIVVGPAEVVELGTVGGSAVVRFTVTVLLTDRLSARPLPSLGGTLLVFFPMRSVLFVDLAPGVGTGGRVVGTGGLVVGTGGLVVGTGGLVVGTGGLVVGTGGLVVGTADLTVRTLALLVGTVDLVVGTV